MNKSNLTPPPPNRRMLVGRVVKVHGLRGDVRIEPHTWNPERFLDLEGVWCETELDGFQFLTIKRFRVEGEYMYVRFRELPLRELAERLLDRDLFVDESLRVELPDNMYYHDDVLGSTVVCQTLGELGTIMEVMAFPANDVWLVDGNFGEILVPVIPDVVLEINNDERLVTVDLPDGLIEEEREISDPRRKNRRQRRKLKSDSNDPQSSADTEVNTEPGD